jgi:hypothetical protein
MLEWHTLILVADRAPLVILCGHGGIRRVDIITINVTHFQ